MNPKNEKILKISSIIFVIIVLIAGNIVCGLNYDAITLALCGTGISFEGKDYEQSQKLGDEMCREIVDEGIVLLKNENGVLPLDQSERKLNVFGWSSIDGGFLLSGKGSGETEVQADKKFSLLAALKAENFEYNNELEKLYNGYKANHDKDFILIQPELGYYSDQIIENAKAFSNTALVVFSRFGGEQMNGEIPEYQTKYKTGNDNRTYLQTSEEEEDLLDLVSRNFEKVIVILNTCNNMHLNFLHDDRVDSALLVGVTGQSGAKSIARALKGDVSPSGKTADTFTYDPLSDPTWANKLKYENHIQYVEDIYFGYKWYETAETEGFFDSVDNEYGKRYDGVVQFPFGYGLSYTKFDWKITNVALPNGGILTDDSTIEITMSVKNTGHFKGKDIIQVYYTPPYYKSGIEKAHVNLAAFAKTALLEPGRTHENIKLSFSAYDMASYDAYDKNRNGSKTYELDKGDYQIKIMKDAHTVSDCDGAVIKCKILEDIVFEKDPVTKEAVKNRVTGETAYSGVPIDGSTVGAESEYLSRSDFKSTFPYQRAERPSNEALITKAGKFLNDAYDTGHMPEQSLGGSLRLVTRADGMEASLSELKGDGTELVFNEELMLELGQDYESEKWDKLLSQMSVEEICFLIECGGYRTEAAESIGKPYCVEYDGPAGFNLNAINQNTSAKWTSYPNVALLACSWNTELAFRWGLSVGVEGNVTGINGWYAPGANLHRSSYNARNFEYYSEDGLLTGKFVAEVIKGARVNNIYCYVKHLVLSEPGSNARDLNTWVTESNLRENYLKPFEIAVKEGGANAVMTAFNRVGGTWAGGSYPVNVEILRNEWGFKGSLITDYDWNDGKMSTEQGIRAGSDKWLNPKRSSQLPLDRTDPTSMSCARTAAKNILFTYTNTYCFAKTYEGGVDEKYRVEIGVKPPKQVFPWWIPAMILMDAAAAGVLTYCFVVTVRKKADGDTPEEKPYEEKK